MSTLGQVAFEAYNKDRGGVNYQGKKTPEWDELPEEIRHAWEEGGKAVHRQICDTAKSDLTKALLRTRGQVAYANMERLVLKWEDLTQAQQDMWEMSIHHLPRDRDLLLSEYGMRMEDVRVYLDGRLLTCVLSVNLLDGWVQVVDPVTMKTTMHCGVIRLEWSKDLKDHYENKQPGSFGNPDNARWERCVDRLKKEGKDG